MGSLVSQLLAGGGGGGNGKPWFLFGCRFLPMNADVSGGASLQAAAPLKGNIAPLLQGMGGPKNLGGVVQQAVLKVGDGYLKNIAGPTGIQPAPIDTSGGSFGSGLGPRGGGGREI